MILLILYHKNRNDADFFNIFLYFYFMKRGVHMANKNQKLFVRIISGVMAGLLLLGCISMLAII